MKKKNKFIGASPAFPIYKEKSKLTAFRKSFGDYTALSSSGVDIGFIEVVHRRWFWGLRFLRRIGIFSRVLTKATMSFTWSRVMENSAA